MKIVDKGEKVKNESLEKERFNNIESLIKNHFSSCDVRRSVLDSFKIESLSKEKIAAFSASDYSPGKMELYSKDYENQAIEFGKEYERRGLHNSFVRKSSTDPEEQFFILEKHYF